LQRSQKFANPFYGLLLVTGILFALTAVSYGVMAFREARPAVAAELPLAAAPNHPLMTWMNRHGEAALLTELVFLAAFTFGAIGTDDFWQRRAAAKTKENSRTADLG
jgi:hypothetical protein